MVYGEIYFLLDNGLAVPFGGPTIEAPPVCLAGG